MAFPAEFVSTYQFRIVGNYLVDFMAGRRVKYYCGMDGYRFGLIESSTFSNPYTNVYLTSTSEVITSNLETVEYGIIGYGINQSLPYHDHSGNDYTGGPVDSDLKSFTPHGFVDRNQSILAYNSGDKTITLTPSSSSFEVYVKGKKFTYTQPLSVNIPIATTGLYGITISPTGNIQIALNVSATNFILNNSSVAFAYWNSTANDLIAFADERHGVGMSGPVHYYLHRVFRTKWLLGMALSDMTPDQAGDHDSHAQFSVSNGEFADEDLTFAVNNNSPQALAPIAYIPVFYKSGSAGIWNKNIATAYPVSPYSVGGRLAYNEYTGSNWTQTEVGDGEFVLTHIYAFNDYLGRIIAIQGQAKYATIEAARIGAEVELTNINLSGMPLAEMLPIASVIYQTSSSYTNTIKARIRSTDTGVNYVDWRYIPYTSIGNSNLHSKLAGLNEDDHHQYSLIDGSRAFTAPVGGVTPTLPAHLVTKAYVDPNTRIVTSSTTAYDNDIVLVQTVSAVTITLQHADHAIITIKKCDTGGAITLQPVSGQIDGSATKSIAILNESVTVVWDGTNWYIISRN